MEETFGSSTKLYTKNGKIIIECDEPLQPFVYELRHIGFVHNVIEQRYELSGYEKLEDAKEICAFYFSSGKTMTPGNRKFIKMIENYYSGGKGKADLDFKKTDDGIWVYSMSETYGSPEEMASDIKKMMAKIIHIRNGRRVCFNR